MAKIISAAVLLVTLSQLSSPALTAQDLNLGGQVRSRFEARDPAAAGAKAFVSMRIRGQVRGELDQGVSVLVQFQDIRLWGEETNTLGDRSADQLDLHQGFVQLDWSGRVDASATIGRQEISFGGQRLIGAVNWTQQARSFDGVRMSAMSTGAGASIDLFAAVLAEAAAQTHDDDAYVFAGYGQLRHLGAGTLDLYGIFNHAGGAATTNQTTVGTRWWGALGTLRWRVEGSVQTGTRNGTDVTAFLVGARLGTSLAAGHASVTLWYDYLSGDDDPADATNRVFDTLFATNHKFYGFADYFLNIERDTGGRGLQDLALKGTYRPAPAVNLGLDLHTFRVARSAGLTTGHL
ncbi:MAG: alginate export family protein, partial [Gemmatimonadales bacterium]